MLVCSKRSLRFWPMIMIVPFELHNPPYYIVTQ